MHGSKFPPLFLFLTALFFVCGSNPNGPGNPSQTSNLTPVNFKIAFIGDQGLGDASRAVLSLIKQEGANAVLHQGDFDYKDDPRAWDAQINEVLGANFPYFASVGNHDRDSFYGANGYQSYLEARLKRLGLTWDGDLGVKSSLYYNGIFILLIGPDIFGASHDQYLREKLAADHSIWSISSWHKNMRAMQAGGKSDETGWGVYEESRKGGAIIATGHEHSYSRTYLLSNFENQIVASTSDTLVIRQDDPQTGADEGRTFAFVSGLGGRSIRDQERSGDWWASIYTSDQNANLGALFGVFNFKGIPNLAYFYFKDIDGVVADAFYVRSEVQNLEKPIGLDFSNINPLQPDTEFCFGLYQDKHVVLSVYDTLGEEIRRLAAQQFGAGYHKIYWDGAGADGALVPSGIYFYRIQAGDFTRTMKLSLLRSP